MSIQTVENTNSRVDYDGNAVRVDFPTTFAFLADGDLLVKTSTDAGAHWTTLTLDDQYSVAGAADPEPGGTVTFGVAPAVGTTVRLERHTPITQELEFQTSGPLPSKALAEELAKLTMICQELARDVADALAGTTGSTYTATRATATFVMGEPPEGSPFPLAVDFGVVPATVVVGRVRNLSTPAEVRTEAPTVPQFTVGGTTATIPYVTGLTPGEQYEVTFEART